MGVAAALTTAPPQKAAPALVTRPSLQLVQRRCDCGEAAGISGRCTACTSTILRPQRDNTTMAAGGEPAPKLVHEALRSAGQPLDEAARQQLETQLGGDFSRVRIHTGTLADASSRAIGANAYTVGQHVVFRAGMYQPGTTPGRQLLAHELTHTIQQAHASPASTLRIGPAHDAHEQAAASAAAAPVAAPPAQAAGAVQRETVQRDGGIIDSLAGASADLIWAAVRKVAPAALIDIIQAVRDKGIIGFLKDKISPVFSKLFGGLTPGSGGFIAGLMGTFTQLMGTAKMVLGALAHNECKPLFDALGKLGDALGTMAGEAWDKLKAFLAPVGDFLTGLWNKFGAPVVDFLVDGWVAQWNAIKDIASQLWGIVSSIGSTAWGWLKHQLGIGDDANDQNGLLQWVQDKLSTAWEQVKGVINPVIAPMKALASNIVAALPIDAILHLRETVHEWLQHAGSMVGSLQNPKGVTANQAALRERLLPAIKAAIVTLGGKISDAGGWVATQIGGLVQTANGLFASLKANSILGLAASAIDWVGDKIKALGDWAQNGVRGLFDVAGQAVAKLSGFVEPLLGVLQKLASVIGNIVKALPGLVMGPVWALIPACIKDPIKDFIVQHILSEIPIISTFVKLPDIWAKIQKVVLDFLTMVFVDGNLGGAAMMVIRAVLEAAGVDVNLFLRVIAKAISSIDDIMMHPLNFLKNIGGAIVQGFQQFGHNIGSNLIAVLQSWLLGPLAALGVEPVKDFSFGSIFKLVTQVLGITMEKLQAKLRTALGPKVMGVVDKVANVATEAWHWITTLYAKGPAGVWEEVKDRAVGIGTSIIAGITGWITTDIVKIATAKVAKLSNPVGEIIEVIQTIAKTIDFVVTKMNKILTMAEAVLDSIGNIVKGNLGPAAAAVEKALVRALGAALAFLAEWLGVSDPGEKIKGIVETIQAKVEIALDWLIAKAIAFAQKLIGKVKSAVGKLLGWDDTKATFTDAAGETHTIFISPGAMPPELMIASKPEKAESKVDTYIQDQKKSSPSFETDNADKIAAVRNAIAASKQAVANVAAANKAGKDAETVSPLHTILMSDNITLATGLHALMGGADPYYEKEAEVKKYGDNLGDAGDNLTPDHEPQDKLMVYVSKMRVTRFTKIKQNVFAGPDSQMRKYQTNDGISMNMSTKRHRLTRTGGGFGGGTLSRAISMIDTKINALPPDAEPVDVRKAIGTVVAGELDEDQAVVSKIYDQPSVDPRTKTKFAAQKGNVKIMNVSAWSDLFQ